MKALAGLWKGEQTQLANTVEVGVTILMLYDSDRK